MNQEQKLDGLIILINYLNQFLVRLSWLQFNILQEIIVNQESDGLR